MAITRASVRKSMDAKRKKFLKTATTPKAIQFGNDRDVLNFACWYYYHYYNAWMGNYISLRDVTYQDDYDLFTHKGTYENVLAELKEDYSDTKDPEVKKLIDLAKVIRRRYEKK